MDDIIQLAKEDFIYSRIMLRAKDLAKIFYKTSQATFDGWVRAGLITRYKIKGGVYYKLSEVDKLIKKSAEDREIGRNT